jgi:predicted pyridoxine 5'-phosphate oxidase superfamily flavin-nucleotide-binding protein
MTQRYREIMFTPAVREAQAQNGSASMFAGQPPAEGGRDAMAEEGRDELTEAETTFIRARDSFYMATISATDWPYMQHRGGPRGFVKILGARTIGIADYRGNRQYMSVGNLAGNDRAALFFMDYMNRRRLKVLARARVVDGEREPELIDKLRDPDYRAKLERGLVFEIEAFDWNCPQHITPRFTEAELQALMIAQQSK